MKKRHRICIYPKDVQQLTGKSYRQSTRILHDIRIHLDKPAESLITVMEFCIYTGLDYEEVIWFLD